MFIADDRGMPVAAAMVLPGIGLPLASARIRSTSPARSTAGAGLALDQVAWFFAVIVASSFCQHIGIESAS
jgi:hypothetical protein